MKEDDLQEAIAENAASLAEIDEALISAPADGDLLQVTFRLLQVMPHDAPVLQIPDACSLVQVRQDLQAAREELLAALPLQSNASLPQPLISSATDLIADSLAASSGAPGACAPAGPLLQATVLRRPHAAGEPLLRACTGLFKLLFRCLQREIGASLHHGCDFTGSTESQ